MRIRLLLATVAGLAALVLFSATPQAPSPLQRAAGSLTAVITGSDGTVLVTHVVDGDTFDIEDGQRVRLVGINTPETVDPRKVVECYGHEASDFTHALLDGQRVRLIKDVSETDKYGRLVRFAYLADGTFINELLVREGYAKAYPYEPDTSKKGLFAQAEAEAKADGKGMWSACGTTGGGSTNAAVGPDGCAIKGNISSGGKVYHLPGCGSYANTSITESSGERWFCTETEAIAAGWHKAGNCP